MRIKNPVCKNCGHKKYMELSWLDDEYKDECGIQQRTHDGKWVGSKNGGRGNCTIVGCKCKRFTEIAESTGTVTK